MVGHDQETRALDYAYKNSWGSNFSKEKLNRLGRVSLYPAGYIVFCHRFPTI